MHFTSYSTMTQIVILNTIISVPKSIKHQLKSAPESTSFLVASPERFLLPFWDPKFCQNWQKIITKPACPPKISQRWPTTLPRCFQTPPRGSKKAPQVLQRAFKRLQCGSTKLPRQPFSTPIQDSQLTVRSLHLTRSTIISMELSRHLFRPQCKIHNS